MRLRIEEGKKLGLGEKDIDIVACPMIDLQHHRRAAAERPTIDDFLFGVDLPDHRTGNAEKLRPIRLSVHLLSREREGLSGKFGKRLRGGNQLIVADAVHLGERDLQFGLNVPEKR